jgi:hypothetical protein
MPIRAASKASKENAGSEDEDFGLEDAWARDVDEADEARRGASGAAAAALVLSDDSGDESGSEADGCLRPWRVYYCSRTHSQLAQVVGEVRKTRFGNRVSVVSLAGRKQLCVNDDVRSLSSAERVNEACLDLQSKSGKGAKKKGAGSVSGQAAGKAATATEGKGGSCPFLAGASVERQRASRAVSDKLLLDPLDVEELAAGTSRTTRRSQRAGRAVCTTPTRARGVVPSATRSEQSGGLLRVLCIAWRAERGTARSAAVHVATARGHTRRARSGPRALGRHH